MPHTLDFAQLSLDAARPALEAHLSQLPGPIDSFLEDHILAARHYAIDIDGARAGFTSIHGESLIVQFHLEPDFGRHGQDVYRAVRRLEKVQAAFAPTCDGFFMAHALDECRVTAPQAYFFAATPASVTLPVPAGYTLQLATPEDADLVVALSGDFVDELARRLKAGEIFLTRRDGECVGVGLIVRGVFIHDVASIGMYTAEAQRRTGVGTATLRLLMARCRAQGLRPLAGCWYYNHRSKQTLERAGLYSPTRLLRISY